MKLPDLFHSQGRIRKYTLQCESFDEQWDADGGYNAVNQVIRVPASGHPIQMDVEDHLRDEMITSALQVSRLAFNPTPIRWP